jgi:hypothetical protein
LNTCLPRALAAADEMNLDVCCMRDVRRYMIPIDELKG